MHADVIFIEVGAVVKVALEVLHVLQQLLLVALEVFVHVPIFIAYVDRHHIVLTSNLVRPRIPQVLPRKWVLVERVLRLLIALSSRRPRVSGVVERLLGNMRLLL